MRSQNILKMHNRHKKLKIIPVHGFEIKMKFPYYITKKFKEIMYSEENHGSNIPLPTFSVSRTVI